MITHNYKVGDQVVVYHQQGITEDAVVTRINGDIIRIETESGDIINVSRSIDKE